MKKISTIVLFFVLLTAFTPAPTEIAIIVNKENTIDKLTSGEVKLYWLRKIKRDGLNLIKTLSRQTAKQKMLTRMPFMRRY